MTNKKTPKSATQRDLKFATRAVRAGTTRSDFGEHSEALYLTSSFVFDDAEQAARRFQNKEPGVVYSRFTNPSVQMFEERLASMEGAERCVATSSGMAAILATCLGLLKAGDHVVTTPSLFGSTVQLFDNYMAKFGVGITYVSLTDPAAWKAAVLPNTKLFYLETPSNPLTEIADISAISAVAIDWSPTACTANNCESLRLRVTGLEFQWISPIVGRERLAAIALPSITAESTREAMRQDPLSAALCAL